MNACRVRSTAAATTTLLITSPQASKIGASQSSTYMGLPLYTEKDQLEFKRKFDSKELKERLNEMEYYVTQEKGTERPFSGEHLHEKQKGSFACVVCEQEIFSTNTKFDSGSGWPSFYDVIKADRVKLIEDRSYGKNSFVRFFF
jgi:hypothetical protein